MPLRLEGCRGCRRHLFNRGVRLGVTEMRHGLDGPPATWSALPAQLTTGAWIAAEGSLLPALGWGLVAANHDGSLLRFAGQMGQRPARARLAIAETRERALSE